ncbi:ComEC/Rec2 family competence protein [Tenacibaculum amylolyticum]|uniref:ComEC/Rec2 family competence protein n=1 Tax=Tenacibaculum amylolyticum TaxID=104269 RepID=UPI0038935299
MKKLFRYTPTCFLLCLILGIYIQFYLNIWKFSFLLLIGLLNGLLCILIITQVLQKRTVYTITTYILFVFLGISTTYITNSKNYVNHYIKTLKDHPTVLLEISSVLKSNSYYNRYKADVLQLDQQKATGRVILNIRKDSLAPKLTPNTILLTPSNLKEINSPLNPHQFDYRKYLLTQGIYHQIFTNSKNVQLISNSKNSIRGIAYKIRSKIQRSLEKHFSQNEFAVINALLLGQRDEISKDLLESYTKAGAIHILAISGLHIGILAFFLSFLLTPIERLPYGKVIKSVLLIVLLSSFAILTGLSASVVRAVTMFSFMIIGMNMNQQQPIEHSLIASMFFLLLIHPMFLFSVGFQLSYLAVFSIVWIQPLLYSLWKPKYWLIDKTWQLSTVSIAAQLGVLPISLYYFHQFPSLFLLSNLLIIPFLGFILFGGILIAVLALLNVLPNILAICYGKIIAFMNAIIIWISKQEVFVLTEISMSYVELFLWYIILVVSFQFIKKATVKRLIFVLSSIFILQITLVIQKYTKNQKNEFIIFHKNKSSLTGIRKGQILQLFPNLDSSSTSKNQIISSYIQKENIKLDTLNKRPAILHLNKQYILFIDSLGVYPKKGLKNSIVVLEHSPKINLNRLIKNIQPQLIIANGTNYKSYINRWKETCKKQKTPFYHTGQNGAYRLLY